MLEESRISSWKHLSLADQQQMIDWIIETKLQIKFTNKEAKQKS